MDPARAHLDPSVLDTELHGRTVGEWLHADISRAQRRTRRVSHVLARVPWRLRYVGAEHVPAEGAVLSCPNHTHGADAWIQGLGHRRDVRVMGKSDMLERGLLARYMRAHGVFPVRRGHGDSGAIDLARLVLVDGQFLVVYPEGTRNRTVGGGAGSPRRGAARLALATGCAILPSATYGLQPGTGREHLPAWLRWLPCTTRVTTAFGEPFRVPVEDDPSPERVAQVRDEIWARILDLYEVARSETARPRRRLRALHAAPAGGTAPI